MFCSFLLLVLSAALEKRLKLFVFFFVKGEKEIYKKKKLWFHMVSCRS